MNTLNTNGKHFWDITDLIPKMMEHGNTRQESIEKLMAIDNCHLIGEGETFEEATGKLLSC